jgi:hypothetical protein
MVQLRRTVAVLLERKVHRQPVGGEADALIDALCDALCEADAHSSQPIRHEAAGVTTGVDNRRMWSRDLPRNEMHVPHDVWQRRDDAHRGGRGGGWRREFRA